MNVTRLEKFRARLVHAMALSTWLSSPLLMADDGNLTQQLHIQQHKSRFQLMLEQVQERAQRRAAAGQTSAAAEAPDAPRTDLGDATQSMRLEPGTVSEPISRDGDEDSMQRLRAEQAFERDQQRILEQRQQRRALIADPDLSGPAARDDFALKRRELMRYDKQNQQQSLQRKLRR